MDGPNASRDALVPRAEFRVRITMSCDRETRPWRIPVFSPAQIELASCGL